jgi:hypothetical protein
MKPLDFVRTNTGGIGMITEVSTTQGIHTASIEFLHSCDGGKTAWWSRDEIEIIDSLPDLLSRELKHPFGADPYQPFGEKEWRKK